MSHAAPTINPASVERNTPLRLETAASMAFPDGSMGVSGLRKEIARGTLQIERIAGRLYTTLDAIERMRELCRVPPKVREPTSERAKDASLSGAFATVRPKSPHATITETASKEAALRVAEGLKRRSAPSVTRQVARSRAL